MYISLLAQMVKNRPAMQETRDRPLGWEDSLEKVMVIHSSILAWRIPWTEEPGRLQFMGLQRVGYNWATCNNGSDSKESACNAGDPSLIPELGWSPGEGNGNPLQYSCLENSRDRGVWQATVHGVAKSQTWLKNYLLSVHSVQDSYVI